jgi:ribonuclease BN (tRNA processing enzyme)
MTHSRRKFIVNSGLSIGSVAVKWPFHSFEKNPKTLTGNRLILLGTQGGPVIRSYRSGPSANCIVYDDVRYLIDAGYGTSLKLTEANIALASLDYIFITHHHSDHNLDLGPLLYNAWVAGLAKNIEIFAPVGLKSLLDFYWKSNEFDIETRIQDEGRSDIRTLVTPTEYKEGTLLSQPGVKIKTLRNIHPPIKESYALKFELGSKIIVFSGDTAYCPELIEFAARADYLIHEVMYGPGIDKLVSRRPNASKLKSSILSHHTLAEDVGKIANQAKVKCLVLNHFVPGDDASLTDDVWKTAVGKNFAGEIIVGKPFLELPL